MSHETKSQALHEIERGEILRFLAEVYPNPVTPNMLMHHLDDSAYSVDDDELGFHFAYLFEKGYIALEEFARRAGEKRRIRWVKITARGIDRIDNRPPESDGVRI